MNSRRRGILIAALGSLLMLSLLGCSEGVERDDAVNSDSGQETAVGSETVDAAASKPADEKAAEGDKEVTKEPIEYDYDEFGKAYDENKAKAVKEYEGKLVHLIGWVDSIDEEYVSVGTDQSGAGGKYFVAYNPVHVYLPVDELAELVPGDKVSVNGVFQYQYYGMFDALLNAELIENMGQTA